MSAYVPYETKDSPDFRPQLYIALEHATQLVPDDELNNARHTNVYQRLADDFVISNACRFGPNKVCTIRSGNYLDLLLQAAEVTAPDGLALSDEDINDLKEVASHELSHGQKAESWGNSHTINHYGIAYMLKANGQPLMWPFQLTTGPLKKIHHAGVAAAPTEPSPIDLAIINNLGYDLDIEAVRERAEAEPALGDEFLFNSPLQSIRAVASRIALRAF